MDDAHCDINKCDYIYEDTRNRCDCIATRFYRTLYDKYTYSSCENHIINNEILFIEITYEEAIVLEVMKS
jgi:hypothetical protein